MDPRALLERHNPILLIHPQDPGRERPGASSPGPHGWADYHPCSAEFFLDRVYQRDRPPGYDYIGALLDRFRPTWESLQPMGLPALRGLISNVSPDQTVPWELDVAAIPSQDPARAWGAYRAYLQGDGRAPFECVTYARYVEGRAGRALQYWYLYTYNDFFNHHEADWEMVTIELGPGDAPVAAGYSNHHGGLRRRWEAVPRDGDRPIVYVARGSHAGYFTYLPSGHALGGELGGTSLPGAIKFLEPLVNATERVIRLLQRVPGFRLLRDHAPADPVLDADAKPEHQGVRISPQLRVLPSAYDVPADSEFWWLRYRGRWGSTRPRITGSVGVSGPWAGAPYDLRWPDPVAWLKTCADAEPRLERLRHALRGRRAAADSRGGRP